MCVNVMMEEYMCVTVMKVLHVCHCYEGTTCVSLL